MLSVASHRRNTNQSHGEAHLSDQDGPRATKAPQWTLASVGEDGKGSEACLLPVRAWTGAAT